MEREKNKKEESIVTCRLVGGLGNQLFQVATTLAFANDYSMKAVFPNVPTSPSFGKPRNVYWNSIFSRLSLGEVDEDGVLKKPSSCAKRIHYTNYTSEFREIPSPKVSNGEIVWVLNGYFQSWKYFDHIRETIKERFVETKEISREIDSKYSEVLDENPVGVHIRRGDYLQLTNVFHQLMLDGYYKQAFNYCDQQNFLIFSDDIEWVQEHWDSSLGSKCHFVSSESDIFEFFLLSRCQKVIIANSTFSWWAAYLSQLRNISSVVIAPSKWFVSNPLFQLEDLIYPNWKTL